MGLPTGIPVAGLGLRRRPEMTPCFLVDARFAAVSIRQVLQALVLSSIARYPQ
jgi:hypothetical protein